MAEAKKTGAKAKRIIDVTHPGKSAPSGTSKSVIISNRPLLKDPMVVDDTQDETDKPSGSPHLETSSQESSTPQTAPTIEPKESKTEEPKAPTIAELAKAGAAKKQRAEDDKTESKKAEKPEAEPKASETTDKGVVPDDQEAVPPPENNIKQAEAEAAEKAKREANIQKLVDGKKYFLPINTVERRKSRQFVIMGIILSVVLALAWVDIALDAGIIELNGVKPLTHLFSN